MKIVDEEDYHELTVLQGYKKEYLCELSERKSRLSICMGCSSYQNIGHICKECLCIVNLKTYLKKESCPLGKW